MDEDKVACCRICRRLLELLESAVQGGMPPAVRAPAVERVRLYLRLLEAKQLNYSRAQPLHNRSIRGYHIVTKGIVAITRPQRLPAVSSVLRPEEASPTTANRRLHSREKVGSVAHVDLG